MAEERRLFRVLGRIADAVTVGSVMPVAVVLAIAGAISAVIRELGWLSAILVFLFIFVATLASAAITVWLIDRSRWLASRGTKPIIDCSWGLRIDGATLLHAPDSDLEWQVYLIIANHKTFPIKFEMVDRRCVIESVIPNVKMEREPFPMVLLGGQGITTIFPPYKKGSLPDKEFFSGEIDVVIKYGHPDGDYSRIMTRKMMFSSALVKRPTSPGLFPVLPVISAQIPLPIGSREMERDEPYHGS